MERIITETVWVHSGATTLPGELGLPPTASGLVLLAHDGNRTRGRALAAMLNRMRLGTLVIDLLTPDERQGAAALCFDIPLLGARLRAATASVAWLVHTRRLRLGYLAAGPSAAAALRVATEPPLHLHIDAVVVQGGRVDLAGQEVLRQLRTPTLLIVGEAAPALLRLNACAATWMPGERRLAVIPGATRQCLEPGALEQAAAQAGQWFREHFTTVRHIPPAGPPGHVTAGAPGHAYRHPERAG